MRAFRRRLVWMTAMWLGFQLSLVASPLVLDCCAPVEVESIGEDECCKGLGPGQICPMHRHRSGHHGNAASATGSPARAVDHMASHHAAPAHHAESPSSQPQPRRNCVMRSACLPSDAALLALATGAGLLPPAISLHHPTVVSTVPDVSVLMRTHIELPVSPPPRV